MTNQTLMNTKTYHQRLNMTLAEVLPGQKVILGNFKEVTSLSTKLLSMGLLPGDEIIVTARAPLGGPIAIRFGDHSSFAIRKEEAKKISVTLN